MDGHFKLTAIQKARMAATNKPLFLLFFITLLLSAQLLQGIETEGRVSQSSDQTQKQQQSLEGKKERWIRKRNNMSRRMMIGSTAPTCTYNECRGCKHKCVAEQVPVEGNDPLNSPYHYRCICHR
ncbi:uncharacterized protein LOC114734066 [Neltuma alba]|uniref:uncharacterized protein LOC114734066 n=1 Tax=Neltuma alba TaxID=207710 RepID=UPI0010A33491|nr:uncharacterized protein LOC114734066 [Prosopis alba]